MSQEIVKKFSKKENPLSKISGYGSGTVDVVMSVDQVAKEAEAISVSAPEINKLAELAENIDFLAINNLKAGYGKMEILHDFNLKIAKGQSLCLIGPNGAGKSTVLHSIFGFTNIFSGSIIVDGQDVTNLHPPKNLQKPE